MTTIQPPVVTTGIVCLSLLVLSQVLTGANGFTVENTEEEQDFPGIQIISLARHEKRWKASDLHEVLRGCPGMTSLVGGRRGGIGVWLIR